MTLPGTWQESRTRTATYDSPTGMMLSGMRHSDARRNPLTLNRYSYCIGNPLFYCDPSGHEQTGEEFTKIYNFAEETYSKGPDDKEWLKEYYRMSSFLDALDIIYGNQYDSDYVINYDYEQSMNQNYVDYVIGKSVYLGRSYICGNVSMKMKTVDKWLDLYSAPTVNQMGRFVQIPLDRPKSREEFLERYDVNAAATWKSFEAKYQKKYGYINSNAYEIVKDSWELGVDDKGMIRSFDENGISRYWVAVGPEVMTEKFSNVKGEQIPSDAMKYGTKLDVILRDSNFNVYFMPAVVGDAKEHTYHNGIYQTGVSWVTGEEKKEHIDASVIEFIRKPPVAEDDTLINTPEFDILGIIVYDREANSN